MSMPALSVMSLQRAFYALAIPIIVTCLLYWGQVVLMPVALAILLAFVLTTPMEWLEHHGLRRAFSVPLVALVAFCCLGALGWLAAAQVGNLGRQLPSYQDNVNRKLAPVYGFVERLEKATAFEKGSPGPQPAEQGDEAGAKPAPVVVQPSHAGSLSWLPMLAQPVLNMGAHILLVVVLTIFILAQHENLRDRLLRLVGSRHVTRTTKAMADAARRVSRYLLLQTATNACVGLGATLGLWLLGVPYAPLWGLLAAALRFIPYVGIWVAALLPFALSVALFAGWTTPLLVLGLFLALELLMYNAVEPVLFGHGTGVAPLALVVVAVFWAWLWGPIGLLLSTPLTVCLVVLGKHVPSLRFFDVLLGDEPPLDATPRFYQRLVARDSDEAALLLEEHLRTNRVEDVYDEVILPALVRAQGERDEHRLTAADERFIFRTTRALLDHVVGHYEPVGGTAGAALRVLGCAARGRLDELALHMLGRLLRPVGGVLEVVPARRLLDEAGPEAPVVCIAALAPGTLSQACSLAKRLRACDPAPSVFVGRWGRGPETTEAQQCLQSAGVEHVGTTLRETRDQLLALAEPMRPAAVGHGDQVALKN